MKLVIDVSYYNDLSPAQWDLLHTVVDGVIIRLSYGLSQDSMAQKHIDSARRVGLPFAGYHWVDPTRELNSQVNFYRTVVDKYKPASMFNDFEQYWSDWAAYMQQDLATAYESRFTPDQLNSYYRQFSDATSNKLSIPVGSYSADWFISKYSPAMGNWVTQRNYWEARYFRYYDNAWWTARQKELGKDFEIAHMKELAAQAQIVKGIGRQFESYVEVKGLSPNIAYHLDWNVFTDEGYYRMFGVEPGSEPEPEPVTRDTYVVVSNEVGDQALRLRSAPSTTAAVVAGETAGTKLKLLEDPKLALSRVGVIDQWLNVEDPQARKGYVAAWFVDLVPMENPPSPDPEAKDPGSSKDLYVAVAPSVGTLGLRLRSEPHYDGPTIAGLKVGTRLKVLDDVEEAEPKIGVINFWLNVSEPGGLVGYVAAWYVEKIEESVPAPDPDQPEEDTSPTLISQDYKVVASALWVRDKPDGNKIGYLWKDEVITVTEIADKWAYFEKGWVFMAYLVAV